MRNIDNTWNGLIQQEMFFEESPQDLEKIVAFLLGPDYDNAGSGFDLMDLHQAISERSGIGKIIKCTPGEGGWN